MCHIEPNVIESKHYKQWNDYTWLCILHDDFISGHRFLSITARNPEIESNRFSNIIRIKCYANTVTATYRCRKTAESHFRISGYGTSLREGKLLCPFLHIYIFIDDSRVPTSFGTTIKWIGIQSVQWFIHIRVIGNSLVDVVVSPSNAFSANVQKYRSKNLSSIESHRPFSHFYRASERLFLFLGALDDLLGCF